MCRFVYYQGPPIYMSALLTEPEHSLIRQSVHAHMRREPLNGDGFGVGWYQEASEPPRDLGRFRSIKPAWSNRNLRDLAAVIRSSRILAHVRAASPGSLVSEANSHPFRVGSRLFMHNGDIGGFGRIRRSLLERLSDPAFDSILGSTDSEHFFALFQDELARIDEGDGGESDGEDRLARAFRRTLAVILELREAHSPERHVHLNVVVTDGRSTLVSRYTTDLPERSQSLFIQRGDRYECRDGICHMVDDETGGAAVLVSSEPLSSDGGWKAVPPGELVLIGETGSVRSESI